MAESVIGLYKTECVRHEGPWRGVDDLELATLNWVYWSRYAGDPSAVEVVGSGWVTWPSCRVSSVPMVVVAAV